MSQSVDIKGKKIDVWPNDLDVIRINDVPPIFYTRFKDLGQYHKPLIKRILELEKDPSFTHRMDIGGSKVARIQDWGIPEAELIHARAVSFFSQGVDNPNPKIGHCWASVSRKNEYLSPHAHTEALGSVVYMLQPGDIDKDNNFLDGRLAFLDPRIPACCKYEPECPTEEFAPDMVEGAMVLFPSHLVHFVHSYLGNTPRITLAWNFSI